MASSVNAKATFYERILSTDIWTFKVGQDQQQFSVHSGALENQSSALTALLRNPMAEANTKTVTWPDTEPETFVRFSQFLYTGDYVSPFLIQIPEAEKPESDIPDKQSIPLAEPTSLHGIGINPNLYRLLKDSCQTCGNFTDCKECRKQRQDIHNEYLKSKYGKSAIATPKDPTNINLARLRRNFESKDYCARLPREDYLEPCDKVPDIVPSRDYKPVLLGHARMYVLADKYGVDPLKGLAVSKLHKFLLKLKQSKYQVEDVVELIEYIYMNTADTVGERLRKLVVEFVVCEEHVMGTNEGFLGLLAAGGDFVTDHHVKLCEIFCPPESSIVEIE
ncbi:hypothetical protein BT63DRAFT_454006 [Microthyrium microscopicum]|uniref:BTB domain-containing protein n=1 Tax=Microthyrium microscopicum TaxID=703497 RepID=A0A6A6UG10_9PEZI|nr:hypothetical protein BT63DRAFT_454006 [Microthyrium microscopicum]